MTCRVFEEKEEEEDDDSYYFGAQRDINKLISVRSMQTAYLMCRRAWDAYLVPRGKGSRIPTHFVDPPTREWT